MRIISGTHKGRTIKPPANFKARPTTDIAKEGLFNVITNMFDLSEIKIADLFGGTGGITFEFASRGAKEIYCIEKNTHHFKFIKEYTSKLGFNNIKLFKTDAFIAIKKLPKVSFDLVFADPPFNLENKIRVVDEVISNNILKNGYIILEHPDNESFSKHPHFHSIRKYGKVNFSFFQIKQEEQGKL